MSPFSYISPTLNNIADLMHCMATKLWGAIKGTDLNRSMVKALILSARNSRTSLSSDT